MTPEQTALALTKQGYRNLKMVADKWAGLRVEAGKTWMYVGITVEGKFDRREPHEELSNALAALAAHNKLEDQKAAQDDQIVTAWG